jgi:aminoglycoside phosphotransferase (APT) family kinase protein
MGVLLRNDAPCPCSIRPGEDGLVGRIWVAAECSGVRPGHTAPISVVRVSQAPEGIHQAEVTEWMVTNIPEISPPLTFTLIAGGRSNLTYRVEDAAGRAWALRRPPLHHVLPTAHDMSREYRLMHSLGPAGIPVPVTIGLCTDEAVNDRPFYVMEFVEGHILRSAAEAEAAFDEATRRGVGGHMADTLAALHDVDPDAVGLGDLGRHEGYIERQLKRWRGQYDQMQVDGVDHGRLVQRVSDELARRVPKQQRTSVVHGDYRMDNVVLADDGTVRAILDWEICTLGDPLADLGLLMDYWADPGDSMGVLGLSPTTAPGFSIKAQILERYDAVSDLDVSGIGYYQAFGYWKLACILQGVYARYVAGAGAGDQGSVDGFPVQIGRLFEMAAEALEATP